MKTILTEIQKDMDEFFTEIDNAIGRKPKKKKAVRLKGFYQTW